MNVDLHIHSNCSDGELTPEQIVQTTKDNGLDVIALTDHDNTNGVGRAIMASKSIGLPKIISGIELSAFLNDKETHILAYGVDYKSTEFNDSMQRIQVLREERNKKIIDKLASLGIKIDYEALKQEYKGNVIGRSHMAKQLVAMQICESVPDAFNRFLSPTGVAYVNTQRLTVQKALQLALRYGGVPVLAHPAKLRMTTSECEAYVKYLVGLGLVGIEASYFSHTNIERDYFVYLAQKYNLYVFGGSDFHSNSYGVKLGAYFNPDTRTQALIEELIAKSN